ncbi:hypothetical protein K439DRAFT_1421435 [Ramaria rubella]|nr:hypothetical protein K439DRAFT_1421435 [Ramaria rubella]
MQEDDEAVLPLHMPSGEVVVQQYIVYSPTFQVPAFYFTVHDGNGSHLCLEDILRTSLFRSHAFINGMSTAPHGISKPDSSLPLLSQGDHPVLGIPCWYFHPCETSVAVIELLEDTKGIEDQVKDKILLQWIEAWLLVLCNVVDLR